MAHPSLYDEGLRQFRDDFKRGHLDSKYDTQLQEYLKVRSRPEDARQTCELLRNETEKKYGSVKVGDNEIFKERWISNILSNIDNFIAVGNVAMQSAPQSVGLAWFAITKALGAIQSNFQLYALFGSGLTDITEMMVTIKHFDKLYDERKKATFEASDVVEALFGHIRSMYAAILDFGFSIHRHISGGKLAQFRHAFKDVFGAEVMKFQGRLDVIVELKRKVLEAADGAFQAKTFQRFDELQGTVSLVETHLSEIKQFQATSAEFFQAQETWRNEIMKGLEEVKATTRPKTRWEYAVQEFNKNKDTLLPLKGAIDLLSDALDVKHSGTYEWIYENDQYTEWRSSTTSSTLCLTGQAGYGKSILLASVVENIDDATDDDKVIVQYMSCDLSSADAGAQAPQSLARISGTIVYQLYQYATLDDQNPGLLEACNKVFSNPKQDRSQKKGSEEKAEKLISAKKKDIDLPELAEALRQLSVHLNKDVFIALDAVDRMSAPDQAELLDSFERLAIRSTDEDATLPCVRVILTSRTTPVSRNIRVVDVGRFNHDDINAKLEADLGQVPSLSPQERQLAQERIKQEAGSDFKYAVQVAIPFMREPFRRPLSKRLEDLPRGIGDAYDQYVQDLSENHLQLLKTALHWTLFAPDPVRVVEIMDAFTGIYLSHDEDSEGRTSNNSDNGRGVRFADPLEVQQLRNAAGPFLDFWEHHKDDEYDEDHKDRDDHKEQWWVELSDESQVHSFCVRDSRKAVDEVGEATIYDPICANCSTSRERTKRSNALHTTEKELHLHMAITCLRHLNCSALQLRSGNLPKGTEARLQAQLSGSNEPDSSSDHGEEPDVSGTQDQATVAGASAAEETTTNARIVPIVDGQITSELKVQNPEHQADHAMSEDIDIPADQDSDVPADAEESSEPAGDCIDCSASDESADDEDRQDAEWGNMMQDTSDDDDGNLYWRQETTDELRYEANCWYYHLRRAENLWTPKEIRNDPAYSELLGELDRFVTNDSFFLRWQWMLYLREMEGFENVPWKPLHIAAYLGLTTWAEHLIATGHDVNEESDGGTPLLVAAFRADSSAMLKLLLNHGADPNVTDSDTGFPCLCRWLRNNQDHANVKLFVDHGADVMKKAPDGSVPLHTLASYGFDNVEALELLLESTNPADPLNIDVMDDQRATPLHYLLERREVPMKLLEAFMEHGADVNAEDSSSRRPLQNASYWGDMAVVRAILPKVKEVNDPDRHGRTALHEAAWAGHRELVEVLINEKGADPNVVDLHNRTPIFFACLSDPGGRIGDSNATIKFLMEVLHQKGYSFSDVNKSTLRQRSPLRQAASRGLSTVVEDVLHMAESQDIDVVAAVNLADTRKGRTALHCAAVGGHHDCVRLLLDHDADVKIEDNTKKKALQLCYEQWALTNQQSFEQTVLLLCEHDSASASTDSELSAIAAMNGSRLVLEKLASLQADLFQPDQYGWTPLALAKRSKSIEAREYLERLARLPSRWVDAEGCTSLSESGLTIVHEGRNRAVLSSDRPLPSDLSSFYFEIRSLPLESSVENPIMAIGFCTHGASSLQFPGWPARQRSEKIRSWAYHGDDGGFFDGHGNHDPSYVRPYKPNDVVGCGIDLEEGRIWFTLNGERLSKTFEGIQDRLFPVVGLKDDVNLETSFVAPWFKDVDSAKVEQQATSGAGTSLGDYGQASSGAKNAEGENPEGENAEGEGGNGDVRTVVS